MLPNEMLISLIYMYILRCWQTLFMWLLLVFRLSLFDFLHLCSIVSLSVWIDKQIPFISVSFLTFLKLHINTSDTLFVLYHFYTSFQHINEGYLAAPLFTVGIILFVLHLINI